MNCPLRRKECRGPPALGTSSTPPTTRHPRRPCRISRRYSITRTLDPQPRPLTYTNLLMAAGGKDKCHQFADVICLNRYYGWYVQDGYQLIGAKKAFIDEMNQWMNTEPNKPFLFTEYGADTDAGVHKLPSVQWSEEYQCEYLTMQHEVFDMFEAVVGEQVWNLCDFQTGEGIMRVDGNKKGVFTRDRQPKAAAYVLKERWETK
ncbi:glycoside hydrolase family 2 TIM barrel-domain containing protein [Bifidobacterium longum]|uniref:glycoside hydrolase family 2 TIM barrel-domain containing protein n=1 Tax=Bifidobacterium longum TaxID=216816 RepID=UPI0027B8E872|nr:glycoside hydrolase family 2 TIM barrel-domain containing protein [Bifidobacterium longum]